LKKIIVLVAAVLIMSAGSAFAVPVIDGSMGVGEWTSGLLISAADVNESGIPDAYDISSLKILSARSGGASDGLYMMWELYGTPTFVTLDPIKKMPVVYLTALDMNQDGDYEDADDRIIEYRATGLVITDGTGAVVSGSAFAAMGSVVEFYIPTGMVSSTPDTSFAGFILLDNGGNPEDDQLPDDGTFKTPEPGSVALLGIGLIGLVGKLRRKFTA